MTCPISCFTHLYYTIYLHHYTVYDYCYTGSTGYIRDPMATGNEVEAGMDRPRNDVNLILLGVALTCIGGTCGVVLCCVV